MTSLFVSYSRKDSAFAHQLLDAFQGHDWDFWIDWEDIPPTVDWMKEIEKGIERAGVFLFLLSPDSAKSKYCWQEIEYAVKNGKRLIPVVVKDISPEEVPPQLCPLNWIFFRESDDFSTSLEKLTTAIQTDYDWVRVQRDLQIKALEWERGKKDKSFLLRGAELQLAEFQLTTKATKEPHPTDLQRYYVSESRKAADRQRRNTVVAVMMAIIALAILSVWGWGKANLATVAQATALAQQGTAEASAATAEIAKKDALAQKGTAQAASIDAVAQAQEAQNQANIAFSRQLAAEAEILRSEQYDLALLLAVEASHDTTEGKRSLSNLLRAEPHLISIVNSGNYLGQGPGGLITGLVLSPDGNQLVAQSTDGAGFWDLNTNEMRSLSPEEYQQFLNDWAPDQIPSPNPEELFQFLKIDDPDKKSTAVSNRAAFATCRNPTSAGGAPGCTSLIYIVSAEFERLITPLQSCSTNENARGFDIRLEGGLYHIQNLKSTRDQPADFELYSVALANRSSNVPSKHVDAVYDPQTNWLATATSTKRTGDHPALIVWNLTDKRPIMELYPDPKLFNYAWQGESAAKINFPNGGTALDICLEGASVRIDIDPASWQTQACEMAGRNLSKIEWRYFIGDEPYRRTCIQWPAGK